MLTLLLASANHAAPQRPEDPLAGQVEFLPVDEAFVLSARRNDRQLVMRWNMPDGYYLYRHAFAVEGDGASLGEPSAGEREGAPLASKEPSAGEREGAPLASKEPSAGEREGPAPRMGEPVIPAGQPKVDEYFGESEVYYGQVEVTVPIHAAATRSRRVLVTYQGCADYGLCYPPQRRLISLSPDGSLEITRSQASAKSDVR
ncbi:MAG: protein-disulfide reductase DsbD family protein [Gammaproteobacteria bacterium]|nr:protein-disulfide reductase DsbD family protein [Gammaproteobacteria bacterium]